MKISFFAIATQPFKSQYPIKYSIKSILPIADEIIIIYGREEKKSEEYLTSLSDKVKIINTNLWPIDWSYESMTYHFDFALKQCTGDICIKFDIDFIFNSRNIDDFKNSLKPFNDKHMIYLPRFNYLDKNHVRYFEKGLYAINRKLLNEEGKSFHIGVKNYVNTLLIDGEYEEVVTGDANKNLWVFNFDCTFMDKNSYMEKQYRWYNAYWRQYGNLDTFGLTKEKIEDKEFLANYIINRNIEKLKYGLKKNQIRYIDKYPKVIWRELENINEDRFGFSYFGNIDFIKMFYSYKKNFDLEKYKNANPHLNFSDEEFETHHHIFSNELVLISNFF